LTALSTSLAAQTAAEINVRYLSTERTKRTVRIREEFRTLLGVRKSPKHEPAVIEQRLWGFWNLGELCGASAAVFGLENTAIRAGLADEQNVE